MMTAAEIRMQFLEFFKSKQHTIVPSAPMVVKNDPTLMFTNAGMNQFKDYFLGNRQPGSRRIADSQKCLRVSGKHNDLEEVGIDTYHHTMFEMLGNWSFGDYFKKEAIGWAWELLTDIYKIDKDRLYVTVFGGDKSLNLPKDMEAFNCWKKIVAEDRILYGSAKDNFWEMGETGPCGPCAEIHIDLRPDDRRKAAKAQSLVNTGDPEVIELWNLVFIEFNRLADGSLKPLPARHVDTGMGFERLCRAIQQKSSNYDTDVFQPLIKEISELSGIAYSKSEKTDIAIRVIADHLRAVAFAIADGQLPSNNKAGYVIRRILRRAVRYGYSYLDFKEPFINRLIPCLVSLMSDAFPELKQQQSFITKVIAEEEFSFLRTLSAGIKRFEEYIAQNSGTLIDGAFTFELFDTYGFPVDLTQLLAKEKGFSLDMQAFEKNMQQQKERSREAAKVDTDDWIIVRNYDGQTEFTGYDTLEDTVEIIKYRKVKAQNKETYQLVLNKTPFYAESGGQVGDMGTLSSGENKIYIEDTKKENDLIIHITKKLPAELEGIFTARVDADKRIATMNNHSATHLLNAALRQVLGNHIEQKGSLVDDKHLRFDFSHFAKLTDKEIADIEAIVNKKIRANIILNESRNIPIDVAKKEMNAVGVFGEKYGDYVRVICFDKDFSTELCGGTHVPATGQIGFFKIISESAIAAGIRRIEGLTALNVENYINSNLNLLDEIKTLIKNPKDPLKGINNLIDDNKNLLKTIDELKREKVQSLKQELLSGIKQVNNINYIIAKVKLDTASVKDLAFSLNNFADNLFIVLANESDGKANLTVMISEALIKSHQLNAAAIIRDISKEINGGGGGQSHFATAGGKNPAGIPAALNKALSFISV
ncbi:MAG: alanine--tRNA ligase [Bacteroidales bacterium]|nr:alanine--tRNA ligase [Bacteroidales bacterium]